MQCKKWYKINITNLKQIFTNAQLFFTYFNCLKRANVKLQKRRKKGGYYENQFHLCFQRETDKFKNRNCRNSFICKTALAALPVFPAACAGADNHF